MRISMIACCMTMMVCRAIAQPSPAPATTSPTPDPARDLARMFVRSLIAGKVEDAQQDCVAEDDLVRLFPNGEQQRGQIHEMVEMRRDMILRVSEAIKDAQLLAETIGEQRQIPMPGAPQGEAMQQVTGIGFKLRKRDGSEEYVRLGALVKIKGLWWIVEGALLGPPPVNPRLIDLPGGGKGVVADAPPPATQPK